MLADIAAADTVDIAAGCYIVAAVPEHMDLLKTIPHVDSCSLASLPDCHRDMRAVAAEDTHCSHYKSYVPG